MIPKVIHYCWFGRNPLPSEFVNYIDSWKKNCPEYDIIEWNEDNFDINSNEYVKQAYTAKKWAFVSDYVRLYVLYNHGGIYMDTDVEVIKPLDAFLELEAFSGFEDEVNIPTGIMACEKGQEAFKELLDYYRHKSFIKPDGSYDVTTNVDIITNILLQYGLKQNNRKQTILGFTLFPKDYFCPKDYRTGIINITENTYTIHHFKGSWESKEVIEKRELKRRLSRFLPAIISDYISVIIVDIKHYGLLDSIKRIRRAKR